jgi:hypothetical protein
MDIIETHTKIVNGKTVLVPSLGLLKQYLPKQAGPVDTASLRKALTAAHGTQLVCPVTMRRYFKTLGLEIQSKKT